MGRTYHTISDQPNHRVMLALSDAKERFHQPLEIAKVQINVQLVSAPRDQNDEPKGPAIKVGGYAARTKTVVIGLSERANFGPDARIFVDGDTCDEWPDAELLATMDRALSFLALVVDKGGNVKRDDLGQPMLRIVKPDIHVDGFKDVVKRHKRNAVEAQQIADYWKNAVQGELAWG